MVQVEPGLNALGLSTCTWKYNVIKPLSNVAFNINLRPYSMVVAAFAPNSWRSVNGEWWELMDSARHVIRHILNPRSLS